jgi:hypothetical protein
MTTRYLRSKALMAKIETTYGVDAVPTGAANAILCQNDVKITWLDTDRVARDVIQAYMGHQQNLPVASRMKLEFDVECQGAGGAVDLPPAYRPAAARLRLRADRQHRRERELPADLHRLRVAHDLLQPGRRARQGARLPRHRAVEDDAEGHPGDALHVHRPLRRRDRRGHHGADAHRLQGAEAREQGEHADLHAARLAASLYDFSVDLKNDVIYRNMVGKEDVVITDRHPEGSAEIEGTLISEKDWFTIANTVALNTCQIIHGAGAGGVYQVDFPQVEIGDPAQSSKDGVVTYVLPLRHIASAAGNDEVKITTK